MSYQHKQLGFVTISAFVIAFLFLVDLLTLSIVFWYNSVPPYLNPLLIGLMLFFAMMGVLFSTMTIKIDNRRLTWHFAFGFWKKSVDLANLSSVQSVNNRWWYGWGIKRIPKGWLYNVSGMSAVEVQLADGKLFRLGTDEPDKLAAAIESAGKTL